MMRIQFLGAAQQVTGSSYLVEAGGLNILVDCGLYQEREFVSRNWKPFPVFPSKIDFVLLTHSHLDHAGLLPKLVREGFSGPVIATSASEDLLKIVLTDSARIQEEDAAYKKKRHKKEGRKGAFPEVPLYTVEEAEKCFSLVRPVEYGQDVALNEKVNVRFSDAGHILGAAMIEIRAQKPDGSSRKLLFSGDVGQWDKPLVQDPSVFKSADYIVMESTYGDREHDKQGDVEDLLCDVINSTVKAGGNLVIPTFAIERAQELMFHLSRLVREDRIPYLMIFLDSPMAVDVTDVFLKHIAYLDEETLQLFREGEPPFRFPGLKLIRSPAESRAINSIRGSCVIMAGSGMCTGGRIKHHLQHNIARPESTILFVGYQARGTLGRIILKEHREEIRIHGNYYPQRARVTQIQGFSAHADRNALLKWLGYLESPPKKVILTHGEEKAIQSLSELVRSRTGWETLSPQYLEILDLQ